MHSGGEENEKSYDKKCENCMLLKLYNSAVLLKGIQGGCGLS